MKPRIQMNRKLMGRKLDDEWLFLHLEKGEYFGMNPTASVMWDELKETKDPSKALKRLEDQLEVDPKTLRKDFRKFVGELKKEGFITVAAFSPKA